ncbi:MAG: AAA family ATPase, partial [Bacteroidales bacterium]
MDVTTFAKAVFNKFPYPPTEGQKRLLWEISKFIFQFSHRPAFLVKGYAGTGKTTLIGSLINLLPFAGYQYVLLAPTGRAAKVLATYSGKKAMTIHKKIYMATTGPDGHIKLIISPNKHSNTLFFVDEASMIPDATQANDFSMFSRNNLLEDLIDYTFEGKNNKLILIGDVAQLPPVGLEVSPALDAEFL